MPWKLIASCIPEFRLLRFHSSTARLHGLHSGPARLRSGPVPVPVCQCRSRSSASRPAPLCVSPSVWTPRLCFPLQPAIRKASPDPSYGDQCHTAMLCAPNLAGKASGPSSRALQRPVALLCECRVAEQGEGRVKQANLPARCQHKVMVPC